MFCKICGAFLENEMVACPKCGAKRQAELYSDTGVHSGSPMKLVMDNTGLHSMQDLTTVKGNLTELNQNTAKIGSEKYPVASDARVYVKNYSGTYLMMGIDEVIKDLDSFSVTAYYDKTPQDGGLIRVFIVKEK